MGACGLSHLGDFPSFRPPSLPPPLLPRPPSSPSSSPLPCPADGGNFLFRGLQKNVCSSYTIRSHFGHFWQIVGGGRFLGAGGFVVFFCRRKRSVSRNRCLTRPVRDLKGCPSQSFNDFTCQNRTRIEIAGKKIDDMGIERVPFANVVEAAAGSTELEATGSLVKLAGETLWRQAASNEPSAIEAKVGARVSTQLFRIIALSLRTVGLQLGDCRR